MLVITAELLHGTIRAASGADTTLTGTPSPEWPPSPARLYQALVAADGTGTRTHVTDGALGLSVLESPPIIFADPARLALVSSILPRFVPVDKNANSTVQEYPARSAQLVRVGARVCPRVPVVAYVWPEADPTRQEVHALKLRAARVGYLGAADSPARLWVDPDMSRVPESLAAWEPDPDGQTFLPVGYPGFLEALDAAFATTLAGDPHRGSWIPRQVERYRDPELTVEVRDVERPECVWVRFNQSIPGRHVVRVAETIRAAVLEAADRIAGGRQDVPEVLHGHHRPGTRGVEHARFLPLPNAGYQYSNGRIHGACIWLPPGTPSQEVQLVRAATASISQLVDPGVFDVAMSGFDGTRAPWASNPARWTGPSKRWATVFPAVYERHVKRNLSLAEVARWCQWAQIPEPAAFRESRVPLIPGAASLAPREIFRQKQSRRPYAHFELTFDEPVYGPLALGRGRHFGPGLMAPLPEVSDSDD